MFEKGNDIKSIEVLVQILDGKELRGELICGLKPSISDTLNSEGQFVELQDCQKNSVFIAKSQIGSVEPIKTGGKTLPRLERSVLENSEWFRVLGVSSAAGADEVKQAYHRLAKRYHPDLYNSEVPEEISRYASEMFSRINVAYDQFQALKLVA